MRGLQTLSRDFRKYYLTYEVDMDYPDKLLFYLTKEHKWKCHYLYVMESEDKVYEFFTPLEGVHETILVDSITKAVSKYYKYKYTNKW